MPDEPTMEPTATVDPTPTPPPMPPAPEPEPTIAQLGDAGKRALDAERAARRSLEAQLKELTPLAEQARKLEESRKTAEQKLTERLTAATSEADTVRSELAKYQAAISKMPAGFDPAELPKVLKRLTGTTPEELAADAEELFALFAAAPTAPPPANGARQPVEQLRPGALPSTPQLPIQDQIAAAEAAGDHRLAGQLKTQWLADIRAKAT